MTKVEQILSIIHEIKPNHADNIREKLQRVGVHYQQMADEFYSKYFELLETKNISLERGVCFYLQFCQDQMFEAIQFQSSGSYSCNSFEEANEKFYNNPEVMEYYLHGLLISQFIWIHHFEMLNFYIECVERVKDEVDSYFEIGGGHGLYLEYANKIINKPIEYNILDISSSSIELSKQFLKNYDVNFIVKDIYDYKCDDKYRFICMGEVLEHVERPDLLLGKLYEMLDDDGYAFITAPTNAPAPEHIYLFQEQKEIRDLLRNCNFEIINDAQFFSENAESDQYAKEYKIASLYGALIKKSHEKR